jgi:hypothetical protein
MYRVQSFDAGSPYGVDHFPTEQKAQAYAQRCIDELGLEAVVFEIEIARVTAKVLAFQPKR